jgi:hypothetical protein
VFSRKFNGPSIAGIAANLAEHAPRGGLSHSQDQGASPSQRAIHCFRHDTKCRFRIAEQIFIQACNIIAEREFSRSPGERSNAIASCSD